MVAEVPAPAELLHQSSGLVAEWGRLCLRGEVHREGRSLSLIVYLANEGTLRNVERIVHASLQGGQGDNNIHRGGTAADSCQLGAVEGDVDIRIDGHHIVEREFNFFQGVCVILCTFAEAIGAEQYLRGACRGTSCIVIIAT